jgi:hypothetical protein
MKAGPFLAKHTRGCTQGSLFIGAGISIVRQREGRLQPVHTNFADRIKSQPGPATALIMGDKQLSPQRTRWMIISKPDYRKAGRGTTVVWVRNADRGVAELLTFVDHGSGGVNVQWLNEKLLYGSVWWGRMVSTDFIFDFEKKELIYREMANYGQLVQPCRR